MLTRSYRRLVPLVLITAVAAGCSQNKMRDRIALLEQANHNLTGQLNRCNGDLTAADAERDALDSQLKLARDDAERLRMQLAAVPAEVEPVAPGWTPVPGGAMIAIEGEVLFAPGKVSLKESAQR
ncbi:MAG: hypothetical protein KJ749_15420, partial [Planctomycetes bacterium]|nr:hypothetical protein [Planctomycetota bacterium]